LNKTVDEKICEVGSTGGELWWPKSEPRLKINNDWRYTTVTMVTRVNSIAIGTVVSMVRQ
jgi:hypothetical protein